MIEWSEDHVVAIGPLNLNLEICGRFWIIWRPGEAHKSKGETTSREG
jgi:hypothetical protein